MTITEQIITVGLCVIATVLTRFLPFIIFRGNKPLPKYVQYLGKALPAAIFGMLVVYCLKNLNVTVYAFGLPELIAIAAVVGLHLWKRQMILSIAAGTIVYMLLIQFVF